MALPVETHTQMMDSYRHLKKGITHSHESLPVLSTKIQLFMGVTDSMYYIFIGNLSHSNQGGGSVQDEIPVEGIGIEAQWARFGGESLL